MNNSDPRRPLEAVATADCPSAPLTLTEGPGTDAFGRRAALQLLAAPTPPARVATVPGWAGSMSSKSPPTHDHAFAVAVGKEDVSGSGRDIPKPGEPLLLRPALTLSAVVPPYRVGLRRSREPVTGTPVHCPADGWSSPVCLNPDSVPVGHFS